MLIRSQKNRDSQHWLTVSDLMSGLMILFIFISVGFMRSTILEKDRANQELERFKQIEVDYEDLLFKNAQIVKKVEQFNELETKYAEAQNQIEQLTQEKSDAEEKLYTLEKKYADLILENEVLNNQLDHLSEVVELYAEIQNQIEQLTQEKSDAEEKLTALEQHYDVLLESEQVIKNDLKKVKDIAETYQQNQEAIYQALQEFFPPQLLAENGFNAEIDRQTLTFIFKSSDTLFDNASANLKDDYKVSLDKFFPLYIQAIMPYKDSINEIRIEGHTSSIWGVFPKDIQAGGAKEKLLHSYFENMKLSQARTNAVLRYMLNTLKNTMSESDHTWLRENTAAVGLSFSKPILDSTGIEDVNRSRRVTFRIITNADSKIQQILQESRVE